MKINTEEIKDGDSVIIKIGIGNIPSQDVDKYVEKHLNALKVTFGCPISVIPAREIDGLDFTIIRNPNREKNNSALEQLKQNLYEIKTIINDINIKYPSAIHSLWDLGKNVDEWDIDDIILKLETSIKTHQLRTSALSKLTEEEKKILLHQL